MTDAEFEAKRNGASAALGRRNEAKFAREALAFPPKGSSEEEEEKWGEENLRLLKAALEAQAEADALSQEVTSELIRRHHPASAYWGTL